ncbi:MAG: LLM class flavin-dependent oxidoreductase, partial [Chloroflexota bacterium]
MAHTLDEVSQGRLILGVGCGWHQPEFDAFGFPFDHRVGRFEEALQIMKPLLQGKSVDFRGKYYQVENCEVVPPGPRAEGIPLLVASKGPRMLRLTAQYADQWNTAWLGDPQALSERLEPLHKACIEEERDPSTLEVTVGVSVAFPDLGETSTYGKEPLTGSVEELAQAFSAYEEAGADHLQLNISPYGLPAIERLAAALRIYRG